MGATEQDVQMQFLSEALVLSSLGGLIGIAFGRCLLRRGFEPVPLVYVCLARFCDCCRRILGFRRSIFRLLSRAQGRELDPIEALRYE